MTFSQLSFHKTATFFQPILLTISTFFQPIVEWIIIIIQSIFSLFLYLMGQLMWLVIKMIICDLLTFIIMMIYHKMSKEIPFLKKKEKLKKEIFGVLFFFYFQLPLLIESWPNIWCLIILIVANTGTAYYMNQDSDRSTSIGFWFLLVLTLLYLYVLGLWLIPMICFQIGFLILIIILDVKCFQN